MFTDEFARIGKRLVAEHLVVGNFGNISRRVPGEGFYIKCTGTYLNSSEEPVFVPLYGDVAKEASSEFRVHRAVYLQTPYEAIVHAHPPYAVAASLVLDEVVAEDCEGQIFCPLIPVTVGAPGSDEIAMNVARVLGEKPLVIVRGHGTFARGKNLDEAFQYTSLAEHSCRVLALKRCFY
jgi:L-fuculose-phosphate aldolase